MIIQGPEHDEFKKERKFNDKKDIEMEDTEKETDMPASNASMEHRKMKQRFQRKRCISKGVLEKS